MTTYPGENPYDDGSSSEPTAPITPEGPQLNPTSAQFPGGHPANQPTPPYPAYQPYPQPPAYGPPTGPVPPPSAYGPLPPPEHPQSTTALITGLVGFIGGLTFCGLGFVVSPFAWAIGRNALREIQASPGRYGGEGNARAGMIMGIVGTALLGLGILALMLFAVVAVASSV